MLWNTVRAVKPRMGKKGIAEMLVGVNMVERRDTRRIDAGKFRGATR